MTNPTPTSTTPNAANTANTAGLKRLRITLVRSMTGNPYVQKKTVLALGLSKVNSVIEQPDNPSIRGMIRKIQHLVQVEEV